MPKTATLKHQQFQLFNSSLASSKASSNKIDLLPFPFKKLTNKSATLNNSNTNKKNNNNHAIITTSTAATTTTNNDSNASNNAHHLGKTTSLGSNWTINSKTSTTPFELTICVQVNLPFNQKTAVRVKPEIILEDLLVVACKEANLDKSKYELVVPSVQTAYTMQDCLSKFDTKEVNLVLLKQQPSHTRQLGK